MTLSKIVSPEEWGDARVALLTEEKAMTGRATPST